MTTLLHARLAVLAGLGLLRPGPRRALFREMREFSSRLPRLLERPLPEAMRLVDARPPDPVDDDLPERDIRELADLTALLDRRSPLGLCLRRSLTRYHFLRRRHVSVTIHVGARRVDAPTATDALGGHAWLTLDGQPYFEDDDRWEDFAVMLSWPAPASDDGAPRA
jgi:hypothetical protein